jgi:Uncharacterised nucleotidyltransferase
VIRLPANAIGAPVEFALACACAIWPPSPVRDQAVVAAAAKVSDWDRFLRVVRRHRMEAMANNALTVAGVACPAGVAAQLEQRAEQTARRSLAMAEESAKLQNRFDQAGVVNLVLKGAAVTALAYDNVPVKQAWDIDLVVPPEQVETAVVLLNMAGYKMVSPAEKLTVEQLRIYVALGREFIFAGSKQIFVELKWTLDQNPSVLTGITARSPSQVVIGPGQMPIRTLNKDDLFSYICVHGGRHCFSRLKWLADIGALLAHEPPQEIERLYRAADQRGAGRSAGEALLLCRQFLGADIPSELLAELEGDRAMVRLARASVMTMAGGDGEQELPQRRIGTIRVVLAHFLLGKGPAFLKSELRLKWVSARDHMQTPLPQWASFLYPLIRLPLFAWRRVKYTIARN